MRKYMRHPSDIPITFAIEGGAGYGSEQLKDVSYGGLSFHSAQALSPGAVVEVMIPIVEPPFVVHAQVSWCRQVIGGFDVGVHFFDANDQFHARMVEQICHIEHYRKQVQEREGRVISSNEAAAEWIKRHAGRFPGYYDTPC